MNTSRYINTNTPGSMDKNTSGYMDTNTPGYMDTNTPELKTLEYDILNPDLLINLKIKFTRKTSKI